VSIALDIIKTHSPDVFGGPYYAFYNSPKPDWLPSTYGSRSLGDDAHVTTRILSGGNLFLRRELCELVGGFDEDYGITVGKAFGYAEDTRIQVVIRERFPNALFFYDPRLYMLHLVREEKMNFQWHVRSHFAMGRDTSRAWHDGRNVTFSYFAVLAGRVMFNFLRGGTGLVFYDRKQYSSYKAYLYDKLLPTFVDAGRLFTYLQIFLQKKARLK
jgi:hypothetical protein